MESFKLKPASTVEDANALYESILRPAVAPLNYLVNMPERFKAAWDNLSESQQETIKAQAKYHKLETDYQIGQFWGTRDLRSEKVEIVKLNENENVEVQPAVVQDKFMSSFEMEMRRRFNR